MTFVMNGPQRISYDSGPWPLHDTAASRRVEALAADGLAPHTLMRRAGEAVARLALALAPHAQRIWIAAGPGNNGGDGFEAAHHLQLAGKQVTVTAIGPAARRPADAAASLARAQDAGVAIESALPVGLRCDLAIDALLGLGVTRAVDGAGADALHLFNGQAAPRLSVDLPSGLDSDRGIAHGDVAAHASHTLALLTLKPGLFTANGRGLAGQVWFDDLRCGDLVAQLPPRAWLGGADAALQVRTSRNHAQHKGSFGDVVVVGGAAGMTGAALLAGRAALAAGGGRVYVCALDPAAPAHDPIWPELMFRPGLWRDPAALCAATVACGCGGGDPVRDALPVLMARTARLVLDADALNAVAADATLQALLTARAGRGQATVLTPHPLEAARLAGAGNAREIQADRLGHAERLAARFGCVVVLKGSGSVIAAPQQASLINASGNARLASAGTGDVLAGWLAGLWAAAQAQPVPAAPHRVAQAAAWLHGAAAEDGDDRTPLPASSLLQRLAAGR
jgi:ADP-dependent NAD(P)H-hydrate dehydratase / NAD(P)H-hydrate epimerase